MLVHLDSKPKVPGLGLLNWEFESLDSDLQENLIQTFYRKFSLSDCIRTKISFRVSGPVLQSTQQPFGKHLACIKKQQLGSSEFKTIVVSNSVFAMVKRSVC